MAVAAQRGACAVATCHGQEKTAAEEGKTNEHLCVTEYVTNVLLRAASPAGRPYK